MRTGAYTVRAPAHAGHARSRAPPARCVAARRHRSRGVEPGGCRTSESTRLIIVLPSFFRRLHFGQGRRADALTRITPFFSLVGLVVVLVISAGLMLFYRDIAMRELEILGQRNTETLAHYVATLVAQDMADFVAKPSADASDRLLRRISRLRSNLGLRAISIQDAKGKIVASTIPGEQGLDNEDDTGFESAARGTPASELVLRNRASRFEHRTAEVDLVHSYVPLRAEPTSGIVGVLEVYADVSSLVRRMERTLTEIIVAGSAAFILVYGTLVLVVRRAARTIEAQQAEIAANTAALRELSSQLQDSEEREKKRLAEELHEGIAQTLAAVKYAVESASRSAAPGGDLGAASVPLDSLVPTIQEAIQDVRSIATDLRPAGLDDFGLLRTMANLCVRLRTRCPQTVVTESYDVTEGEIPARLKIVVYRIVEAVLEDIGRNCTSKSARLQLDAEDETLRLVIEHDASTVDELADTGGALPVAERRAVVSGGEFAVRMQRGGRLTIVATWPRAIVAMRAKPAA